jgi:hypothetical protein
MQQDLTEGHHACRVVIIDGPDSWAKCLVEEKVIEKFYPVDFTDEAAIFDKCLARIKQAEQVRSLFMKHASIFRKQCVDIIKGRSCFPSPSDKRAWLVHMCGLCGIMMRFFN